MHRVPWLPLAVGAAGIALVGAFDIWGTHLPLSDEFFFRWSIERTAAAGRLRLWPGTLPLSLVQIGAALPLAAAGADGWTYRLTVLPWLGVEAAFSFLIARRLTADSFWAGVAAALLPAAPIAMAVATGLMSDTAYVALLLGALYFGLRWLEGGGGMWPCLLFTALATVQRQHGFLIPLAMTAALPAAASIRRWRGPAALWATALAALAIPPLLGLRTETMAAQATGALVPRGLVNLFGALVTVPPVLGLLLIPFTVSLLRRGPAPPGRSRWDLVPVVVGVSALAAAAVFVLHFGVGVFPGDVFGWWGLGQVHLPGDKPSAWPPLVFGGLSLLAVATAGLLLLWRRHEFRPSRLGPAGVLLVAAAVTQALPMFLTTAEDRYDLPVVAPLVPLLAAWASGWTGRLDRPARAWALVALAAGLLLYVRGESDYQAWQVARDAAARQAYSTYAPSEMDGGFEAVGRYYAIPAVDATGRLPGGLRGMALVSPRAALELAPGCDRRPGVGYGGPAPGKVVLVDLAHPGMRGCR